MKLETCSWQILTIENTDITKRVAIKNDNENDCTFFLNHVTWKRCENTLLWFLIVYWKVRFPSLLRPNILFSTSMKRFFFLVKSNEQKILQRSVVLYIVTVMVRSNYVIPKRIRPINCGYNTYIANTSRDVSLLPYDKLLKFLKKIYM